MVFKWLPLSLLLVSAVHSYPNAKTTPIDVSKGEVPLTDALDDESGSSEVVQPIFARNEEAIVDSQPQNIQPARHDEDFDSHLQEMPFLQSDVSYCLRRAATRFPPIGDPDRLTHEELRGVSKALRSTSCTRLLVRTSMGMARNGLNFTLPPFLSNITFPPLFGSSPLQLPSLPFLNKTSTAPALFGLLNLTRPQGTPAQQVQANQAPPPTTTASPLLNVACVPCPPFEAILLTQVLEAIDQCAAQNVITCCTCVFKATIKSIFSGGAIASTTAAPAVVNNLARGDDLDLLFYRK